KIFLYKEDFEKFSEGLQGVVEYIKANQEVIEKRYEPNPEENNFESNGELIQKDVYSFYYNQVIASCEKRECLLIVIEIEYCRSHLRVAFFMRYLLKLRLLCSRILNMLRKC